MHPKIVQAILFLGAAGVLSVVQWLTPAPLPSAVKPLPAQSGPAHDDTFDYLAGDGGAYSEPNDPQPNTGSPNAQAWEKASQEVFMDVRNDKIDAFLTLSSPAGLWITGLQGHPDKLHVTRTELSQDLHRHGSLYRAIFLNHRSGNFVVSPDDQAHVLTMLLK